MIRILPPIGEPKRLPHIPTHTMVLSNGLTLVVAERRGLPIVDLELVILAGAEKDAPEQSGRSSMLTEMIDEGTTTRSAFEIAENLDYFGAHLSAQAGFDVMTVSLHVLSQHLDAALEIFADVAANAALPVDEYRRKQDERLGALKQERDEASLLASKALALGVFGRHPYGAPIGGTLQSISALTRDQLAELYRVRVDPRKAVLIVVGDVDAKGLQATVERHFQGWLPQNIINSGNEPAKEAVEALPRRVLLVDKPGAAQAELRVGHAAPARSTEDYFSLVVMNAMLGGSFTSRLNTILRERMGVTYGAGSRFRLRRSGGSFAVASAVFTEAAARSARVVIEEMQRMIDQKVSAEELRRAQSYLALGLPRQFESTEDIAAHLRDQLVYGLAPDYWQSYVDRIFAVTAGDVQNAAAHHLHPTTATVVVVADAAEVRPALERRKLGEVIPTDVET